MLRRVSPFGNLRINSYLRLPEAYRSLSRPSSAPDAKAFPLRSYQLDLPSRFRRTARKAFWFSSSKSNYAGIELTKLSCFTLLTKSSTINVCFPLLLALHTFGCFVQFSRCGSDLRSEDLTSSAELNSACGKVLPPAKRLCAHASVRPICDGSPLKSDSSTRPMPNT